MNVKNIFIKIPCMALISLMLLMSYASASIIFVSSQIDGGIGYSGGSYSSTGFDHSFNSQTDTDRGEAQVQAFNYDLYNQLTWRVRGYGVTIRSKITTIPDDTHAWAESSFAFRIQGSPVNYSIETSAYMINTRFMGYSDLTHERECLSLGCERDGLSAGKTTGTLSEGYTYVLDFSPSLTGNDKNAEFLLQVSEPPQIILLTLAFLAVIFRQKLIGNVNAVSKHYFLKEHL